MSAARPVAWEAEESASVKAAPAAAFGYWTDVRNWSGDPGVTRVELDGPFRPGARGRTHLAGGGHADWKVLEMEEGRSATIETTLEEAAVRFAFRFEDEEGGGCRLTQRVQLLGEGASRYVEAVREGFGPPNLGDGLRALARRIERACSPGG